MEENGPIFFEKTTTTTTISFFNWHLSIVDSTRLHQDVFIQVCDVSLTTSASHFPTLPTHTYPGVVPSIRQFSLLLLCRLKPRRDFMYPYTI